MGCFSSRVEAPTEELPGPPAVELDAPTPADTAPPTQPAAALPSAPDLGVSEEKLERWRKLGGGDLERVLASGAAALLDAQWVISHAEAGGVLTHRQALPEEAFLTLSHSRLQARHRCRQTERKTQPTKGGIGGRHAATTQGF